MKSQTRFCHCQIYRKHIQKLCRMHLTILRRQLNIRTGHLFSSKGAAAIFLNESTSSSTEFFARLDLLFKAIASNCYALIFSYSASGTVIASNINSG